MHGIGEGAGVSWTVEREGCDHPSLEEAETHGASWGGAHRGAHNTSQGTAPSHYQLFLKTIDQIFKMEKQTEGKGEGFPSASLLPQMAVTSRPKPGAPSGSPCMWQATYREEAPKALCSLPLCTLSSRATITPPSELESPTGRIGEAARRPKGI